jgi:hypothetical protein
MDELCLSKSLNEKVCGECEYYINDNLTMNILTLSDLLTIIVDFVSSISENKLVVNIDTWKLTCDYSYRQDSTSIDTVCDVDEVLLYNAKSIVNSLLRKWYTSNICTNGEKCTINSIMYALAYSEDIKCLIFSLKLVDTITENNVYNPEEQYLNEKIHDDEQLPSTEFYKLEIINGGSNNSGRKRVDSLTEVTVHELKSGIDKLLHDARPSMQYLSAAIEKEYITSTIINKWKIQLSNFIINSGILKCKSNISIDIAKLKVNSMLEIVEYSIFFNTDGTKKRLGSDQQTIDTIVSNFQTYVINFNMTE